MMLANANGVDPLVWVIAAILIGVVTPVVVAWIKARRDTRAIRDQVVNRHSTNLRDELDERHGELLDRLSSLAGTVGSVDRRTARIGEEVVDDRSELYRMRADMYAAIRKADATIAKHHPEG